MKTAVTDVKEAVTDVQTKIEDVGSDVKTAVTDVKEAVSDVGFSIDRMRQAMQNSVLEGKLLLNTNLRSYSIKWLKGAVVANPTITGFVFYKVLLNFLPVATNRIPTTWE